MTKKLNDILNGVKSSKIETPDVSNIYKWNGKDGEKFVGKHKIEKHDDCVGNSDDVYKGKTKKSEYKRQSDDVYEEVEDLEEKYEGFKKLKGELAAKGAKTPGALAAWIGRKKYGKEKFQKAAASDHKMKEDASCSGKSKKKLLFDKEMKESSCSTPSSMNKNPFSSTTGSNTGKETTPKKETATIPKSLSKIVTKEDVKNLDEISRKKALNYAVAATNRASEIDKQIPYRTKANSEKYDDSRKEKSKRLAGAKLAVDKYYKRAKVPATEEVEIQETAPPNPKIEKWIKANKSRFVKEYGKEKGMEVLYAKAWKMHNESSPATTTDYAGPGAAGWTTGRMDTGTL